MDNLARQCRGDTEYLTSLYKNMFASFARHPDVADLPVQVVTCMDASGSMFDLYRNGRMQRVIDKFFRLCDHPIRYCLNGPVGFWSKKPSVWRGHDG